MKDEYILPRECQGQPKKGSFPSSIGQDCTNALASRARSSVSSSCFLKACDLHKSGLPLLYLACAAAATMNSGIEIRQTAARLKAGRTKYRREGGREEADANGDHLQARKGVRGKGGGRQCHQCPSVGHNPIRITPCLSGKAYVCTVQYDFI